MTENLDYGFFGHCIKNALDIETFRTTFLALILFVLECNDQNNLRDHDMYKRYHQRLQTYRSNNKISKIICNLFLKVHKDSNSITRCAIECDFEIIVSVIRLHFSHIEIDVHDREIHRIRSYLKKEIALEENGV